MSKIIQLLIPLGIIAISTGCASPYMRDRQRDAADVLTLTIGAGLGAKARVGPAQAGFLLQGDGYGLRGGSFGDQSNNRESWFVPPTHDVQLLITGVEGYEPPGDTAKERHKEFYSEPVAPLITITPPEEQCASYYTQIDLVAALGASFRLGFNPGELLDFILGWAAIDIFDDDATLRMAEAEELRRQQNLTLEERRRIRDANLKDSSSGNQKTDPLK